MVPAMKALDRYHRIYNQSLLYMASEQLTKAQTHVRVFHREWQNVKAKCEFDTKFSLGRKEHYLLDHELEQMELLEYSGGIRQ